MLHITNGDSVIRGLAEGRIPGDYLAWCDPLHDGPVPQIDSLDELSEIRARALAGFGWGEFDEIRDRFSQRDLRLRSFYRHEEVVLWFEHDLFDQLQLAQLLDWFGGRDMQGVKLSLIEIDSHPEVVPFYGLGQLSGSQLAALLPARVCVSEGRFAEAREVWRAFRAPDPAGIRLIRLLEEYPAVDDGLSRTERQLLRAAASGAESKSELYQCSQKFEECPWGDASVFLRLANLASGANCALDQLAGDRFRINRNGERLLAGQADWIEMRGGMDTWIGGVHLQGKEPEWRWDRAVNRLRSRTEWNSARRPYETPSS